MIKIRVNSNLSEGGGRRQRERKQKMLQSFLNMTSPDIEPGRIFEAKFGYMNVEKWRVLSYVELKMMNPSLWQSDKKEPVYSFDAVLEPDPEGWKPEDEYRVSFIPWKRYDNNFRVIGFEWAARDPLHNQTIGFLKWV